MGTVYDADAAVWHLTVRFPAGGEVAALAVAKHHLFVERAWPQDSAEEAERVMWLAGKPNVNLDAVAARMRPEARAALLAALTRKATP